MIHIGVFYKHKAVNAWIKYHSESRFFHDAPTGLLGMLPKQRWVHRRRSQRKPASCTIHNSLQTAAVDARMPFDLLLKRNTSAHSRFVPLACINLFFLVATAAAAAAVVAAVTAATRQAAEHEIDMLQQLRHPNVVPFLGVQRVSQKPKAKQSWRLYGKHAHAGVFSCVSPVSAVDAN